MTKIPLNASAHITVAKSPSLRTAYRQKMNAHPAVKNARADLNLYLITKGYINPDSPLSMSKQDFFRMKSDPTFQAKLGHVSIFS